jgi:hypothetical protein
VDAERNKTEATEQTLQPQLLIAEHVLLDASMIPGQHAFEMPYQWAVSLVGNWEYPGRHRGLNRTA